MDNFIQDSLDELAELVNIPEESRDGNWPVILQEEVEVYIDYFVHAEDAIPRLMTYIEHNDLNLVNFEPVVNEIQAQVADIHEIEPIFVGNAMDDNDDNFVLPGNAVPQPMHGASKRKSKRKSKYKRKSKGGSKGKKKGKRSKAKRRSQKRKPRKKKILRRSKK